MESFVSPIDQFISLMMEATIENEEFGKNATKLLQLLSAYNFGDPIPDEFWDIFQNIGNTVAHDQNGTMIFSKSQSLIMVFLNELMKKKGLAITIPSRETIQQKLKQALVGLRYHDILEDVFLQSFVYFTGKSVDYYGFSTIISKGVLDAVDAIQSQPDFEQSIELADDIYGTRVNLFKAFWANPEIIKHVLDQSEIFWETNISGNLVVFP